MRTAPSGSAHCNFRENIMKKLDKKQIPQFVALCILSAGMFGYFVVRLVTPSPAAAGSRPRTVAEASQARPSATLPSAPAAGKEEKKAGTVAAALIEPSAEEEVPPPGAGMRDPFVAGFVDPKTALLVPVAVPVKPIVAALPAPVKPPVQVASIREVSPAAPLVPAPPLGLRSFPAAGVGLASIQPSFPSVVQSLPLAAPTWTVTGVLQNEADQVAVLRSGEARRIVRTGDFVDNLYRVVNVTRNAVVLRHGATFYQLTLGAVKPTPLSRKPAVTPAPSPDPISKPQEAELSPARPKITLATLVQSAPSKALSLVAPVRITVDSAMHFLDGSVAGTTEARAHVELGLALYQSGKQAQARSQWRQVLSMDDFDAADEAQKLLYRYL